MNKIQHYLSLIKFSHTIFGFPFAIIGFLFALKNSNSGFSYSIVIPAILSIITARTAAMAFNRWSDRQYDIANPRTSNREIPRGIISEKNAIYFTLFNSVLFIFSTWFINQICFYLSPLALTIIFGYSYTKRFTFLSHWFLGLGLMVAPVGAFMAITGFLCFDIILLGLSVLFWVAGFDIVYAFQDMDFDKKTGLHSIPSKFGIRKGFTIAVISHTLSLILLFLWLYIYNFFSLFIIIGFSCFLILILNQHIQFIKNQYHTTNSLFFLNNGIGSLLLCIFYMLDFFSC